MENIIEVLRKLELSEYESKVYLALISLGEATSGEILTKSNINSGKIYLILESLAKKGLVTEVVKNKVRHFSAVNPRSIKKYLDQKQKEFDDKRKLFDHVLPDLLKSFSRSTSTPEIRVYTGFEGMKSAFDQEIFRYAKNKELLVYGILNYDIHNQSLVRYFTTKVFGERDRKGVKVRKIVSKYGKENIVETKAKVKHIDYDSFFTYNVIGDLVILAIWTEEPIFITIVSKEVSEGLRQNFNSIWKIAKN